jgi:flavin reductase (DIM6/NTAB) family NADH-FMN oxidoreductase RutF
MPSPVWVIGTYMEDGTPNISTAAWAGICSGAPASLVVAYQRSRCTYENILRNRAFTVNIASSKHVAEVDYAGMTKGRNTDKFRDTGLTPVKSEIVNAPYVKEFPLVIELSLLHSLDVNMHIVFIGKIEDVKAEESVLDAQGLPDIEKVEPFVFSFPQRKYYKTGGYLADAWSEGRRLKGPE